MTVMTVNVHEAKTQLSQLLLRIGMGEDVVIAKAGKPVARLGPYTAQPVQRVPGSAQGQVWIVPDFSAPLPDEVLAAIEAQGCCYVYTLPDHHRDPFDRILVAQSQLEKLLQPGPTPSFTRAPTRSSLTASGPADPSAERSWASGKSASQLPGRSPGTFGWAGVFSFNGNKIIATSGSGMFVSADKELIDHARKLSTQARDPAPHYQHSEIGYNYRLSNLLAAVGRGQLQVLEDRVRRKREICKFYADTLGDLPGITLMPEAPWGRCTRWLTCITVDPLMFGADREAIHLALEAENIESRPLWKLMHLQPVFQGCEIVGGSVAAALFRDGLCLPSGTALSEGELARVAAVVRGVMGHGDAETRR